ncbi:transcriptional regulator [Streptomyces genisteinicus]|uniref:Transcriptional regulator n=1 Tax=Streptomyces genisteinicus TaxID=2768068 RepID=A0A7H0I532_9ACTN|nr:transcriptional regulator [Streptomyces genisteinicus]QNP67898.1 transcriptional regulator [Streptomyces genisteinicus]
MTPVKNAGTRTVPTKLAALAAGVSEATIRQWATRGKLTRYGRPGRREYSLQELTALVARTAD